MLNILERRLAKDIARNGGNEFAARIALIKELQNRRTRKTPGWEREAVRMCLVYALWKHSRSPTGRFEDPAQLELFDDLPHLEEPVPIGPPIGLHGMPTDARHRSHGARAPRDAG